MLIGYTPSQLFVRIMRNATRRLNHSYMYSYDREIGSFDPALDEPREWEAELGSQARSVICLNIDFSR